jgi:hypothetical protein
VGLQDLAAPGVRVLPRSVLDLDVKAPDYREKVLVNTVKNACNPGH